MRRPSNAQDVMKCVAMLLMCVDHIQVYWYPNWVWARVLGRPVMPLFCLFAGYNSRQRIGWANAYVGLVLQLLPWLALRYWPVPNILWPIWLGQVILSIWPKELLGTASAWWIIMALGVLWPWTSHWFDYGLLSVAIVLLGGYWREQPSQKGWVCLATCVLVCAHIEGNFFWRAHFFDVWQAQIAVIWMVVTSIWLWRTNIAAPTVWPWRQLSQHCLAWYAGHLLFLQITAIIWR